MLKALLEKDKKMLKVDSTLFCHVDLGAMAKEALDDQFHEQHQVVPLDDHRLCVQQQIKSTKR